MSPTAAAQYGTLIRESTLRKQWIFALRIPGRRQYLSILDEAVHQAVRGEKTAAEALRHAAARWKEITERIGVKNQQTAYLHSLGVP